MQDHDNPMRGRTITLTAFLVSAMALVVLASLLLLGLQLAVLSWTLALLFILTLSPEDIPNISRSSIFGPHQ